MTHKDVKGVTEYRLSLKSVMCPEGEHRRFSPSHVLLPLKMQPVVVVSRVLNKAIVVPK